MISNVSESATRDSFIALTGDDREYRRYRELEEKVGIFAQKIWPTLLSPLLSKASLRAKFQTPQESAIWDYLVEKPLSALIEDHLADDTLRGAVFTDAKIGISTYPEDPSLLQNRTFLYHTIGQGTGEWRVPLGGMGALVDALLKKAQALGVVTKTRAEVTRVETGHRTSAVYYLEDGKEAVLEAKNVLFNTSSDVINRCLPGACDEHQVEGSVFKINLILKKLPVLKDRRVSAREAFTGTFHLFEGYEHMRASYQNARTGILGEHLPGEMYCHSLTDPSILSADLQAKGWHTLTLFGLDVPYGWFTEDNAAKTEAVTQNFTALDQPFYRGRHRRLPGSGRQRDRLHRGQITPGSGKGPGAAQGQHFPRQPDLAFCRTRGRNWHVGGGNELSKRAGVWLKRQKGRRGERHPRAQRGDEGAGEERLAVRPYSGCRHPMLPADSSSFVPDRPGRLIRAPAPGLALPSGKS